MGSSTPKIDTFTKTSIHEWKVNAVACAQLTFRMLQTKTYPGPKLQGPLLLTWFSFDPSMEK